MRSSIAGLKLDHAQARMKGAPRTVKALFRAVNGGLHAAEEGSYVWAEP
jgi:hypothetical protein